MTQKKIWLDVDTGIDDALGIMLACGNQSVQITGISTVNGNVSRPQASANTRQVLSMIGRSDDIFVFDGASHPLIRNPQFEHAVHGQDGLGGLADAAFATTSTQPGFGPDQIIEAVMKHKQDISLVMTGPLTNLALAIRKEPQITQYINEVIFMGGVIQGSGNITPAAEYNMYVDPEAAHIVFHSGLSHLIQVGLDVTRQALLTEDHISKLQENNKAAGDFVSTLTSHYRQRYEARNGVKACALHDPLAVACAIQPDILKTNHHFVDIEYSSSISDGSLVADEYQRSGKKPNMFVGLSTDSPLFFDIFQQALVSLDINEGVS